MAIKPTPLKNNQTSKDRHSPADTAVSAQKLRLAPPQHQPKLPDANKFPYDEFGDKRDLPKERLDREKLDDKLLINDLAKLGDQSRRLVHEFMKTMPELKSDLKPEPAKLEPTAAYKLWCDRPAGRETNPAKWIQEQHGDLIGTEGARAAIGRRDAMLMRAYAKWIAPGRHPDDKLELDTKPYANLKQMSPEEALEFKREQSKAASQRYRTSKGATGNHMI